MVTPLSVAVPLFWTVPPPVVVSVPPVIVLPVELDDRAGARRLDGAAGVGEGADQVERATVGGLERARVGHGVGRGDLKCDRSGWR